MEKSFVFNSINGDRKYKAEDFASYFASFIGNGVFPNPATGLQVIDNNNMSVTVQAGKGWINGYYYQNTGDFILKIDVADSLLNRIDRVVLRLDFNTRKVNLFIKKGTFASSPVAPSLQRDADMYELGIADIYVRAGVISIIQSNITDLRLNSNVCGIVHGVVDQVDTTAIFNQFQDWYSKTKEAYDKDIAMWTKDKKETFDKWYKESTEDFLKQWNEWFENTGIWEKDFNNWFETLKDKLDGNIAAKLTKDVEQLKKDVENIDIPVKSVNKKTGDIELKAADITTENGQTIETQLADITKEIGNINDNALPTELKGKSLTEQTKQLFQYASDGKQKIATAVTGKGVSASGSDSFSTLASKISLIETGAKYLDIVNDTDIVNIVVKGDYLYVLKYLYDHAVLYKYSKEGHLIEDYKISISSGQSVCINKDYILHVYYTYYTQKTTIYIYNIETKQIILKKDLREPDSYPKIIMTNSYIYILQTTGTYRILIYNYDLSFVKEITDNNYISYFQYSATTLIKDNILYISYVPGSSSATPQILQLKEKYSGDFTIDTFYNSNILFTFVNTLLGGI
ncbi:phage structural protein [Clostridium sporogenes]|uniref:Uncharacterized protein n=1 Tax=Clostridium sporogenes TaxID=1509 RepID=A0A7U4JQ05_CLOSG|nr:hypothetical protein [Clostridium sporogenes]AKC63158.1 hypothetical protein CLSPO_c24380 [Clostridium sporogenes]KCZ67845.1 hypothetical protein CSPO_7c01880 [Clostridium sporogenes]OOO65494.1 hypothetical protein BS099_14490 [Clostridium sporogenes]SQC39973.1 phage structural protein [Clostridium sporogenes]